MRAPTLQRASPPKLCTDGVAPTAGCANETDYDSSWLRWDFSRRLLFGRFDWRYQARDADTSVLRATNLISRARARRPRAQTRGDALKVALAQRAATTWGVNIYYNVLQGVVEKPVAWLFAREQRRRARRGEEVLDAASRMGAGLALQMKMQLFNAVGVAATYIIWAMMVRLPLSATPSSMRVYTTIVADVQNARACDARLGLSLFTCDPPRQLAWTHARKRCHSAPADISMRARAALLRLLPPRRASS